MTCGVEESVDMVVERSNAKRCQDVVTSLQSIDLDIVAVFRRTATIDGRCVDRVSLGVENVATCTNDNLVHSPLEPRCIRDVFGNKSRANPLISSNSVGPLYIIR